MTANSDRPILPGADFLQLDPAAAPARGLTDWLVAELRTAITAGRLLPGTALPPTRALAADLGTSRGTIVEAYHRLAEEGLVTGRPGAGTLVAENTSPRIAGPWFTGDPAPPTWTPRAARSPLPVGPRAGIELDLSPGLPDLSAFPRTAWLRAERAALREASAADLGYGDPRGHPRLRHELVGWLGRTRGLRADPDDVLVVTGVAQSLALLAQVLRTGARTTIGAGTTIGVEDPGSRGAREELAYWGLEPRPIPVDERGMRIDELARSGVGLALLTPAHQFPTGVVLAPGRRRELLAWAHDGGLVLEDDYDAEHRYDRAPVPALQASAPDRVAHTGSTSKTLAPGLRLGWLVAPRQLQEALVEAKYAADLGSPALPQLVLARLIANGDLERHVRAVRTRQRARRDALLAAVARYLPAADVGGIAAGLHLLVTLPRLAPGADLELAERAAGEGVLVHPLSWHRMAPGPPGFVLGYAAQPPDRLSEAVRRLASVLPRPPEADRRKDW